MVLPTYNEQDNITTVLNSSIDALKQLGESWELIVVDNYSNDRTPEIVEKLAAQDKRIRLIRHDENRLYSGSCQTALREAQGDIVAIMDSDGQFSAHDLGDLIAKLEEGANLVFGWRRERHDPVSRLMMSRLFNLLGSFWLGFPFNDLNCGIRVLDRQAADLIEIRHRINMANPELYMRAVDAKLVVDEAPVSHAERKQGQTSHNFKQFWRIVVDVNTYFHRLYAESSSTRRNG